MHQTEINLRCCWIHTVIRGITAPAAMEAMSETVIMNVCFLLAYRNNAKYPTLSFGASVCLSMICLSWSLRPDVRVFAPSSDGASSFSSIPLPGGESMLSDAALTAAFSCGAAMVSYWLLEAGLSMFLERVSRQDVFHPARFQPRRHYPNALAQDRIRFDVSPPR